MRRGLILSAAFTLVMFGAVGCGGDIGGLGGDGTGSTQQNEGAGSGDHHEGSGGGEQSGAGGGSSEPTCDQLRAEGVTPLPDRCNTGSTGGAGGGEHSGTGGGEQSGTGGGEQSGAGGGSSEPTCDQLRAEGAVLPDRCKTCDELRAEGVNPLPDRCGGGTGGGNP